jgi:hypothetical protein
VTHEPSKSPARPEVDTSILAAALVIGTVSLTAGVVVAPLWLHHLGVVAAVLFTEMDVIGTPNVAFILFEAVVGPTGFGVLCWWCWRTVRNAVIRSTRRWWLQTLVVLGVGALGVTLTLSDHPVRIDASDATHVWAGFLFRLGNGLLYGFGVVWIGHLIIRVPETADDEESDDDEPSADVDETVEDGSGDNDETAEDS